MTRRALVVGPAEHGVVRHGRALAAAAGWPVIDDPSALANTLGGGADDTVVAEVTDRLFGATADLSGPALRELADRVHASGARLVVSLHDVPDPADGAVFERRAAVYRTVVAAADGVIVASEVDRARLLALTPRAPSRLAVLPLPVHLAHAEAGPAAGTEHEPEAGPVAAPDVDQPPESVTVFGFVYPGKGHDEVVCAMQRSERVGNLPLVIVGRPADGHEGMVEAWSAAVDVRVTGFIADDELAALLQAPTIPVAPSRRVGSSASVLTWWAYGRRPLAPDTAHSRELTDRHPAALARYDTVADLASALDAALDEPSTTWLDAGARPGPDVAAVARQRDEILRAWLLP